MSKPLASYGVNQIIRTEKNAAQKIDEARQRRVMRLKQAQSEAKQEVDKLRADREEQFLIFKRNANTFGRDAEIRVENAAHKAISEMIEEAEKHRTKIVEEILQLVCDIKPELHRNYFLVKYKNRRSESVSKLKQPDKLIDAPPEEPIKADDEEEEGLTISKVDMFDNFGKSGASNTSKNTVTMKKPSSDGGSLGINVSVEATRKDSILSKKSKKEFASKGGIGFVEDTFASEPDEGLAPAESLDSMKIGRKDSLFLKKLHSTNKTEVINDDDDEDDYVGVGVAVADDEDEEDEDDDVARPRKSSEKQPANIVIQTLVDETPKRNSIYTEPLLNESAEIESPESSDTKTPRAESCENTRVPGDEDKEEEPKPKIDRFIYQAVVEIASRNVFDPKLREPSDEQAPLVKKESKKSNKSSKSSDAESSKRNASSGSQSPNRNASSGSRSPSRHASSDSRSPDRHASSDSRSPNRHPSSDSRSPNRHASSGSRSPNRNASPDSQPPAQKGESDSQPSTQKGESSTKTSSGNDVPCVFIETKSTSLENLSVPPNTIASDPDPLEDTRDSSRTKMKRIETDPKISSKSSSETNVPRTESEPKVCPGALCDGQEPPQRNAQKIYTIHSKYINAPLKIIIPDNTDCAPRMIRLHTGDTEQYVNLNPVQHAATDEQLAAPPKGQEVCDSTGDNTSITIKTTPTPSLVDQITSENQSVKEAISKMSNADAKQSFPAASFQHPCCPRNVVQKPPAIPEEQLETHKPINLSQNISDFNVSEILLNVNPTNTTKSPTTISVKSKGSRNLITSSRQTCSVTMSTAFNTNSEQEDDDSTEPEF